LITWVAPYYFN